MKVRMGQWIAEDPESSSRHNDRSGRGLPNYKFGAWGCRITNSTGQVTWRVNLNNTITFFKV